MKPRDRSRSSRRDAPSPSHSRGFGRRNPPPDATGAEAEFLFRSREQGTELVFVLDTGERVRGSIEYYDRHLIKVVREDGPGLVLRKPHISRIEET